MACPHLTTINKAYADTMETLITQVQIAELVGVSRQRVGQLYHAGKIPAPATIIAGRPVWTLAAIERWNDWRQAEMKQARTNER